MERRTNSSIIRRMGNRIKPSFKQREQDKDGNEIDSG
jgi:hypothetical protein